MAIFQDRRQLWGTQESQETTLLHFRFFLFSGRFHLWKILNKKPEVADMVEIIMKITTSP